VTARNLLIRKIQISWLGDSFFLIRKSHTGGRKIVFPKEIEFSQQENRVFLASFGAKLAQAAVLGGGVSCAEESAKVPRMGTQWYGAGSMVLSGRPGSPVGKLLNVSVEQNTIVHKTCQFCELYHFTHFLLKRNWHPDLRAPGCQGILRAHHRSGNPTSSSPAPIWEPNQAPYRPWLPPCRRRRPGAAPLPHPRRAGVTGARRGLRP